MGDNDRTAFILVAMFVIMFVFFVLAIIALSFGTEWFGWF